jgi:hypothetical protein
MSNPDRALVLLQHVDALALRLSELEHLRKLVLKAEQRILDLAHRKESIGQEESQPRFWN